VRGQRLLTAPGGNQERGGSKNKGDRRGIGHFTTFGGRKIAVRPGADNTHFSRECAPNSGARTGLAVRKEKFHRAYKKANNLVDSWEFK